MIRTEKYLTSFDELHIPAMQLFDLSNDLVVQCLNFISGISVKATDPLEAYKISYYRNKLIFDIKQFSILVRDILFERFKTSHYLKDKFTEEDKAFQQLHGIKQVFTEAVAALEKKFDYVQNLKTIDKRLADQWSHHNNPENEIRGQVEEIQKQLGFIRDADACLNKVRDDIKAYSDWKAGIYNDFKKSLALVSDRINQINTKILELSEASTSELKSFIQLNKKYYAELDAENNKYPVEEYPFQTEEQSRIPVATKDSALVYKEVPFNLQITRWEESEIYPMVLAVQEKIIQIYDRSLSGLFNMLNRLQLFTGDQSNLADFQADSLRNYLDKIHDNILEAQEMLEKTTEKIREKLEKELPVSNVFSQDRIYLSLPSGLSLSRYGRRKWLWMDRSKFEELWKSIKKFFQDLFKMSKIYEDQGNIAEVVRFIDHMSYTDMDRLSQSLFFGKGHMGKTFMMQRENYSKVLAEAAERWKEGYRGSLLIYGKRLSGRTTLAEFTGFSNLFNRIVFVQPNKEMHYKGRIIEATFDLGEILQQLDYYSVSDQLGVVIDDIELWRDKHFSWYYNIQSLINAMSKSGRRLFFVVGCGHLGKKQLDEYFDFSNQFMSLYCSDRMAKEEILHAILVRYGASQTSDEQLSKAELTKRANQIIQVNEHNIGVCLMEWYRLFYMDDKKRELEGRISMSAFKNLVKKYGYLLRHMLKLKITTELELKEAVGAENFRYVNQDIQLLLGLKVLERMQSTRQLRINEHIVDEIELVLLNE